MKLNLLLEIFLETLWYVSTYKSISNEGKLGFWFNVLCKYLKWWITPTGPIFALEGPKSSSQRQYDSCSLSEHSIAITQCTVRPCFPKTVLEFRVILGKCTRKVDDQKLNILVHFWYWCRYQKLACCSSPI